MSEYINEALLDASPYKKQQAEAKGLVGKWERTGLLDGLNEEFQRSSMATLLENQAKQLINEANGYAVERINNAKGEAALFEMILAEYKKAPQITKDRYFIETMNTIFAGNSNKVIVDTELENFLPMLNLKNKEKK